MPSTITINLPSLQNAIASLKKLSEDDEIALALKKVCNSLPNRSTRAAVGYVKLHEEKLIKLVNALDTLFKRTVTTLENTEEHFRSVDVEVAWSYEEIGA